MSWECLFDFEGELPEVVEAVGNAFDDFDLVVNAFEPGGVHCVSAVTEDAVRIFLQPSCESGQDGMSILAG